MVRREFIRASVAGAAGLASNIGKPLSTTPSKKALMNAGHQNHSSDQDLVVLASLGVRHICSSLPSSTLDDNWSVEGLSRLRERVEKHGVKLDMVPLPLSS